MAVTSQKPIISYLASGSATSFAYPFKILSTSTLQVYVDGILTTTGYTVTGVGTLTGGSVVFTTAPRAGARIIILRKVPIERSTDYIEGGALPASVLDDDFDRLVYMMQDMRADAISFTEYQTLADSINLDASVAVAASNSATAAAAAASTQAGAATTQAGIATTQATNAATSASTSTTQAGIATTQASNAATSASTATTQASNAATSASTATTQASNAATSASTATTQAAIATAATAIVANPTLQSLNGGQLAGFRNYLINGGMQAAQRGNISISGTTNIYGGCDRWLTSISGTAVSAVVLQTAMSSTVSGKGQQIGNVTTTGTTTVALTQRIEALNSVGLNGKTITFSGKLYQTTGSTQPITISIMKATALDTFAGGGTVFSSTALSVPNGVVTPFSFTCILGSTDASNGLSVALSYAGMSALSNAQFLFGDMQLEIGAIATVFELRPIVIELLLCQRYYYKSYPQDIAPGTVSSVGVLTGIAANSTNGEWLNGRWPVTMRASPTCTIYSPITGAAGVFRNMTTNTDISSSIGNPSTVGFSGINTAMTSGNLGYVHVTAVAEL